VRLLSQPGAGSRLGNSSGSSNAIKALWIALAAVLVSAAWEFTQARFSTFLRSSFDEIAICAAVAFVVALVLLHRQEAAAIAREKANFNNLVEHLPGLACMVDLNRNVVRWNKRYLETLGYSGEELSKLKAPDTIAEEYRERVDSVMGAAFTTGHAEVEAAWLTKQGRRVPCYLTGVRISDGTNVFVLGVGIDISDLKRAQEAVAKSEVEFRRLLANLPDVTWTMDSERNVTYVSPNVKEILGYEAEEVLAGGKEIRIARIHPEDVDLVKNSYHALFQEDRPVDVEYRMRRKDDSWVWLHSRSLRSFRQGGLLFADGLLSDITERKQAERINSQLASIVTSSIAAIIGKTIDGTIVSWNPGAEKILGYTADEAIGQHISTLVAPEKLREVPEVIAKVLRGEHVPRFDSVCLRKDGTRIDVSLAISAITDKTGRVLGISTIANDISAQKNAERELLRAKEAAEAATRAKSEFLANISHELRTPMNGILGMTDLTLDTQLDTEQREYLLTIQSSGRALLELIDKLLDFTNAGSGTTALNRVSFSLPETLNQTMRPFFFQAQQIGLEILCYADPELPDTVIGDPEPLRKVLVNLIGNALKFTYQGRVNVHVNCISRTDTAVELLFAVSDTGIGIPPEKHALIFEPFTQSDGSSTRKHGGTGLGLAVCRQSVELMGGRIWVESEPGSGSTFYFTVPLGLVSASSIPRQQPSTSLVI